MKNKIVFWGAPSYVIVVLEALINAGYDIVVVITAPDEQAGRKKIVTPPPVKTFALKNNLRLLQPEKLRDNYELASCLSPAPQHSFSGSLVPDICVVAAYGKIIPKEYLDIPKYGFINIHPSLLPKYRGPSPIKTAILNGDKETGVTIMVIDEEMDHGKIAASSNYSISNNKYHAEIEKEIWDLGSKLLIETLPKYLSGDIKPREQNHSQATVTKKFSRQDGKINWSGSAEKIYNQIRALSLKPGVWTTWNNKTLNILQANLGVELLSNLGAQLLSPGAVTLVDNQIVVATGKCYLILKTIQLEGGKEMDAKDFLNGHPDFPNSKLK